MTTHQEVQLNAGAQGNPTVGSSVIRGAETWQFFAFVFGASVTFALTVLDDLPWSRHWWPLKLIMKTLAFLAVAYLTL
jgi:hypothetical protein